MATPDGFVKLKTVKYKRQFHTIYRSINEVQGDLKQMLEDEELEALQPCERDGSPAPDGVLKGKPIHFFITRKRCHFKLPSNLPFFGGEYEDDEEEEDLDDEDLDGLDESEDEEGVRTPPPSPAVLPQNLQGQQTPITPAVPQTPQRPIEQHPAQPPHTPHTAFLPGASLGPSTPLTAATPTIPVTPTPIATPTATTPTTTTTTTTSSTPASQFVHSGQVAVNDKRAPAQNRELLLYVKINNNFYEIRGGLTTKCLGAKKEPEKEDNLIIGRWLWLTCVSNNNKTGVNFTMKCLLVIAGPNDQNIYLTSPEFVTLSTASSRKVTYLTQLTMKQPSELGEEEEDDEGDEEGEGMQIAYAAAAASPLPITSGGHTHTHASLPPPPPVSAPPSAPAAVPMQMQQSMQHVMGGDAEGGLAFVVSAIQRSGDDMTFTTTSQLPQGAALVAPKAGKYALRKGKKVMYRKLSLEESGGAGGGGQGGEGSNTTSTTSGGGGGGGMSMSDRKKGKKVKTFDEWLEELREFKNIHGHCQPKRKHFGKKETEQKKLAYWVERQRSNWKTGTLSEARKKRLDELGFIWPKKGKKRRSPNDKEEGDLTLSPSTSMDTTSSPPPPPRPAGKNTEGRKKQEQTPIGAERPLAETTTTTPSRKASGLDSGNGGGNVDNKRRLDDEWMRLREERERMERERNQYTEQVKKEYEKKTWELLEKWKEEWRGLENGRRELEEKTKRLHNEQMRKENQKRKAVGGPESAAAVAGASAMGESATPLKKRKLGGGEGGGGVAVAGVVEGGGGGVTLLDKMVEDALGWEAGLDDGEKESEKQEVSSTLSSMDTTSTQGVVGGLGGFTSLAILQRLDEILANQKVILEALGRPQQQK